MSGYRPSSRECLKKDKVKATRTDYINSDKVAVSFMKPVLNRDVREKAAVRQRVDMQNIADKHLLFALMKPWKRQRL